jgi:hypothetical protein
MTNKSKPEIDYIIMNDCCPKCGQKIPEPESENDAVMCECTVWFVSSEKKKKIVCHDCPNLLKNGNQLRCKACNIKTKLEHSRYACLLKDVAMVKMK